MKDLSTTYLGLKLRNPVIAASSGLTLNMEDLVALDKSGIGAIVLKSIFEEEIRMELEKDQFQMNKDSFIYPETMDFYDDFNVVDDELTRYLRIIREAKKNTAVPVIASINCVTAEKWPYYAGVLQDAGADALELNVFALPTNFNITAQETEQLYFDIVDHVKKEVSIPISLKISFYNSNLGSLIKRLSESGVAGIVLFNRFYNPDIDPETFEITSSHVFSTPQEVSLTLRWIAIMAGRVKCDLAASTGIHDGMTVVKQILAGAQAVEIASVLYRKGIPYVTEMLKDMEEWMDRKGFDSVDEFRGKVSQAAVKDPAAFERVQFMKYFAGKE